MRPSNAADEDNLPPTPAPETAKINSQRRERLLCLGDNALCGVPIAELAVHLAEKAPLLLEHETWLKPFVVSTYIYFAAETANSTSCSSRNTSNAEGTDVPFMADSHAVSDRGSGQTVLPHPASAVRPQNMLQRRNNVTLMQYKNCPILSQCDLFHNLRRAKD